MLKLPKNNYIAYQYNLNNIQNINFSVKLFKK